MDDRTLIAQALIRYTEAGWEVVSLSNAGFQVKLAPVVNAGAAAMLVFTPALLGTAAALFSPLFIPVAWSVALFGIALVFAALIVLHHMTQRPQLIYVTVDRLRAEAAQS